MTTIIHFSGLNTDPVSLIHLASDLRLRVCLQVSLLPCWLNFGQMGLGPVGPHPLGNTNQFHPFLWESQGSEFISARAFICYMNGDGNNTATYFT